MKTKSYGQVELLAYSTDWRFNRRNKKKPPFDRLIGVFVRHSNGLEFRISKCECEINDYEKLPNKI